MRTPCALRGIVSRSPEEHLGCALKETPVDSSDFDHETIFDEIAAARAAVLAGAHASDLEVIDAPAATAVSPSARAGNPEKLKNARCPFWSRFKLKQANTVTTQ